MATCKFIDVQTEDHAPHKWRVSLNEEVFKKFFMQGGGGVVHKVFGDGSLFSPLLFGKFFDPSDAFPLWEFDSDILLNNLRTSGQTTVDWLQTDHEYVLKAEIPGENNVHIYVDNGKVMEISGQFKQQRVSKDWRTGNWWEHGYVRRLEVPEDADWRKLEAKLSNDVLLEIRIPKSNSNGEIKQGKDGSASNSA